MNDSINLVAQSYGRKNEYLRTIFSIWSYYAHVSPDLRRTKTLLYTDDPDFFKAFFREIPVTYIVLTPQRMKAMRGENDFLHRMKIAIIADAFEQTTGNVLYLDGDTFFIGSPSDLSGRLSARQLFMHTPEYSFRSMLELPLPSGAPFHAVLAHIREKEFTMAGGRKQKFDDGLFSWNAGVMLLHREIKDLLPDVFAITDQLYAGTRNHASEQYAFSLVLQSYARLEACDQVVYHYWYRVKKQIADDFLKQNLPSWQTHSFEMQMEYTRVWAQRLPGIFESHVSTLRDNAIQAFNSGYMRKGYYWTLRALVRNPFSVSFIRDVAYHTRRSLLDKGIPEH